MPECDNQLCGVESTAPPPLQQTRRDEQAEPSRLQNGRQKALHATSDLGYRAVSAAIHQCRSWSMTLRSHVKAEKKLWKHPGNPRMPPTVCHVQSTPKQRSGCKFPAPPQRRGQRRAEWTDEADLMDNFGGDEKGTGAWGWQASCNGRMERREEAEDVKVVGTSRAGSTPGPDGYATLDKCDREARGGSARDDSGVVVRWGNGARRMQGRLIW